MYKESKHEFDTDPTKTERIELKNGLFMEVQEKEPGVFHIVNENIYDQRDPYKTERDELEIGYEDWDDDVEILTDPEYEVYDVLGIATEIKIGKVVLEGEIMRAPSLQELKEALKKVKICAVNPFDS